MVGSWPHGGFDVNEFAAPPTFTLTAANVDALAEKLEDYFVDATVIDRTFVASQIRAYANASVLAERPLKWGVPGRIWAIAAVFFGCAIALLMIGWSLFGVPSGTIFILWGGVLLGDSIFILLMKCEPRFRWMLME